MGVPVPVYARLTGLLVQEVFPYTLQAKVFYMVFTFQYQRYVQYMTDVCFNLNISLGYMDVFNVT